MVKARPYRRAVLTAALGAAVVLGAFALGWFPQDPLRGLAESRLRLLVGPGSRISELKVVPGRLEAEIQGLVLDSPAFHFETDRVSVTLSPRTLMNQGLFIDRLHMEGGKLTLRSSAHSDTSGPAPAGPLVIRGIDIRGITVSGESPAREEAWVLRSLSLRGGLGEGTLTLAVEGGVWPHQPPISLYPSSARLRASSSLDLQLEALDLGLEKTRLTAAGLLARAGKLEPDLQFEARADLSELGALADLAASNGILTARGRLWGPMDALTADGEFSGERLQASGWEIENAQGRARYEAAGDLVTATTRLRLLGGQGTFEGRLQGDAAEGRLSASGVDLRRLLKEFDGLSAPDVLGAASATVRFKGNPSRAMTVQAEAEATGRYASDTRFKARARAQGPVELPSPSLDLTWTAALETKPEGQGPLPPGQLSATGTAKGALPPRIEADLEGTLALPGPAGTVVLHGRAIAKGERMNTELRVTGLGGSAEGSTETRGTRVVSMEVAGRDLDLARAAPQAVGRAAFQFKGSGPFDGLSGTGGMRIEDLGVGGVRLGGLQAALELTRGAATIRAGLPLIGAQAEAHLAPPKQGTVRGTLSLSDLPLNLATPLMPGERDLGGTLNGGATFEVPLSDPSAGSVDGRIDSLDLSSGTLSAKAAGPFKVGFAHGQVHLEDLRLKGHGLSAEIDARAGLTENSKLDLRLILDSDLGGLPLPTDWTLKGRGRAEVVVDGTRAAPRAHGFVSVDDVSLESPQAPPTRVSSGRIELEGDAVRIPGLTATLGKGSLTLEGLVPVASFWPEARRNRASLSAEEESRLSLAWSGLEAAELWRRLSPGAGTTVESVLAGRAELRGGLRSLAELRGTLTLPATTARINDLTLDIAPSETRLRSGQIDTENVEIRSGGGTLRLSGVVDLSSRSLDVSGKGALDLRALSPLMAEAALTGTSAVDLRVSGTLDAPKPEGSWRVTDGTLRLRELPQAVTGLNGEILLEGETLRLQNTSATLGGGKLTGSGSARFGGAGLREADFKFSGRDMALRYPEGMRSRLEADVTLSGGAGAFRLTGDIRVLRGLYDLDTAFEESLKAVPVEKVDSPLLRSVALDLRLNTQSPVMVRNNLAQLQANGRLTVRGDLQTPAPVGTLDIASGGKIYLQGREFVIGNGRLVYAGTWDPELTLDASARIPDLDRATGNPRADVDVTVGLEGRLSAPRFSLRSDPAYSRLEIVNLIAAGDSQNPSTRLALQGSAASLLAGRLSRTFGNLGLDQVSIQPELVTREGEVETGARFTFGKRLSSRVNLIYSLSLQDPEGRFIQLEATPGRDVTLSIRRTDAGSFTYGAGQRFHFGGSRSRTESTERRVAITEVRLEGDLPDDPTPLRSELHAAAGDRRTVWDLQDDADRLRGLLVKEGYLEAEVSARFEDHAAVFGVSRGSRYGWRVEGMDEPPDLSPTIGSSLFEEEALELGRAALLKELRQRGRLRATVEARVEEEGDLRLLSFAVQPGPRLQAEVAFPGASALSFSRLLQAAGGPGRLLTEPDAAIGGILAAYHSAFYLEARAEAPRVSDGPPVSIVVPVREGPRARIAAVRFEGATLNEQDLMGVIDIRRGSEYDPDRALAAVDALRGHYFGLGYSSVRVNPRLDVQGADVEVTFEVAEGERVTVAEVVIAGLRHARASLIRRQIGIQAGDPLDPRKVAEMERRMLDLGLFTRAAATVSEDNPATITLALEEGDRLRAGYLMSYNDDKGNRVELDSELRNLLGGGIALGGRVSAGPDLRDARVALTVPSLLQPLGRITTSLFRLHEDLPLVAGDSSGPTFERVQTGGQIQGSRPLGNRWNALYGYRFKKVSVISEFLNSSHRVAGIDLSLLRDTRDSPVDARRGRFLSFSVEIAPRALGSDFNFVKGLAQAFLTHPLNDSLTWAQGYRLGLAHAFGGEPLVSDEGFEAGGANSIRGFGSGVVGREDNFFGRQAVIVLNQELRYRHPSGFGGVFFYDAGNTFASVRDFSLRLRHAMGAGVRWESPVGLLRADFGVPLFPRPGEPRYKLFFSFGQAF